MAIQSWRSLCGQSLYEQAHFKSKTVLDELLVNALVRSEVSSFYRGVCTCYYRFKQTLAAAFCQTYYRYIISDDFRWPSGANFVSCKTPSGCVQQKVINTLNIVDIIINWRERVLQCATITQNTRFSVDNIPSFPSHLLVRSYF